MTVVDSVFEIQFISNWKGRQLAKDWRATETVVEARKAKDTIVTGEDEVFKGKVLQEQQKAELYHMYCQVEPNRLDFQLLVTYGML